MKSFLTKCIVLLLSLSSAFAAFNASNLSINDVSKVLPSGFTLPPDLEGVDIPQVDDVKKVFKEKCISVSGSDAAFEEADQASTVLMECVQKLVNISAISDEIEKAKPNGNLDTVFNKYCDKRGKALECVDAFTSSLDPCLTEEERDQKKVFTNITKSLLEFVCHENGNQIALFIAEEGPECFGDRQEALQECMNSTMGKYFGGETPTLDNLPTFIIKDEHCHDMNRLEKCVVLELEKCKESTPANLMEALFRFVRKETPCKNIKPGMLDGRGSANRSNSAALNVLVGTWLMALVAKFFVSSH